MRRYPLAPLSDAMVGIDREVKPVPISIREKLKSRKGASLIFALLAFLVCAVVGTVVISAASASGGRVKDMAAVDQRYYAVMSAAQLFKEELNNQTFTVERVYENKVTTRTRHTKNPDGSVTSGTPEEIPPAGQKYTIKAALPAVAPAEPAQQPVTGTMAGTSLLTDAALHYVLGDSIDNANWDVDSANFVLLQQAFNESAHMLQSWNLTVSAAEADGSTVDDLTVRVTAEMKADGSIEFTFVNAVLQDDLTSVAAADPFTVKFTLKASVRDNSGRPDTKVNSVSTVDGSADTGVYTETIERTTTKTKTTVITWTASEIKKVA